MINYLGYGIVIIMLLAFFYFGYRGNYRGYPKDFLDTIICTPIIFVLGPFEWQDPFLKIRKWVWKKIDPDFKTD